MKNLRQLCAATVLMMSIFLYAFAGDMQCGVTSPATSQSTEMASNASAIMVVLFLQNVLTLL
jgi:hypothetical protein